MARIGWWRVVLLSAALSVPNARAATRTTYVPGAVESAGRNGAFYASTLWITNPSWDAASATVTFIPFAGRAVPAAATLPIAGGETLAVEHVLATLFNLGADAGTLVVTSSSALVLQLATANVADPAGTYGLSLRPVAAADVLSAGQTGHAVWVSQSADGSTGYRTNVSVTLLDPDSAADVRIYDDHGVVAGSTAFSGAAPATYQVSVPDVVRSGALLVGRVELTVTKGRALGYAVVNDNVTSDGIAVQAERAATGAADLLLDGVARTAGAYGARWTTDVRLFNPGASPVDVSVDALGFAQTPATLHVTLPASGLRELVDILGPSGLGLPDGVAGGLRFRAASPILVAARTINSDPTGARAGTFSGFERAVPYPSGLLAAPAVATVPGVDQSADEHGFRTNLALLGGPAGGAGNLVLRDSGGAEVARTPFTLAAGQWTQRNVTGWFPGAAVPAGARLDVEVTSGALDGYAPRIDNGSGDAVILPLNALGACVVPNVTITAARSVCAGSDGNRASVPFATGATYDWTADGGTITSGQGTNAITYRAGTGGAVTLGVEAKSGTCTATGGTAVPTVSPVGIDAFTISAAPDADGRFTATWATTGADAVSLTGAGALPPSGSTTLVPVAGSTLTLSATNGCGTATKSLAAPATAPPPSSFDLLDRGVGAGTLDEETALLYKVYAMFGDSRLPAAYRGAASGLPDTTVLAEAMSRFDSLSSATQDTIAPFLVPPFHKGSWLHARPASAGRHVRSLFDLVHFCGDVDVDNWDSVPAAEGRFRVWWPKGNAVEERRARTSADIIDRQVWPTLSSFMKSPLPDGGAHLPCRGGDDAVDISFVDVDPSSTVPFGANGAHVPTYILINKNAVEGWDHLLAHEIMHAMQYAYKTLEAPMDRKIRWLTESTAQWAMDEVWKAPKGNFGGEWRALDFFLPQPELSLDDEGKNHAYGAYLFPFYLARSTGSPNVIGAIWSKTESMTALEAVNASIDGGFHRQWPEFVKLNYNDGRAPVSKYRDWDAIVKRPRIVEQEVRLGAPQVVYPMEFGSLPHLSAVYYHFRFTDENVRTVLFLNGFSFVFFDGVSDFVRPFTAYFTGVVSQAKRKGAKVQALILREGETEWDAQDWTEKPTVYFCRDRKADRIMELVLIFSNSSYEKGWELEYLSRPPSLFVNNVGCWQWKGTATMTEVWYPGVTSTSTATVTWDLMFPYTGGEPFPSTGLQKTGPLWGPMFEATGALRWQVSGTSGGGCSYSGGVSMAISKNDSSPEGVLDVFNLLPPTSIYSRAAGGWGQQHEVAYTATCPHGSGSETRFFTWWDLPLTETYPVSPDGKISISNTYRGVDYRADFTPQRE